MNGIREIAAGRGVARNGCNAQDAPMGAATFGERVGAYLLRLRTEQGWSREHVAALIRERTGQTTTTNTYRRWEITGDVSIVDLAATVSVLGGSLAELVGVATAENGGPSEDERRGRPGFDADQSVQRGRPEASASEPAPPPARSRRTRQGRRDR